jgi:large subunit ribosomal protein L30
MASTLRIVQVKSANGANHPQRETLRSLGLHGIRTATERPDLPSVRGMIKTVDHLVAVSDSGSAKGGDGDG